MKMKPVTKGAWERVKGAKDKEYQHVSGVLVVYRCNDWCWEIVGGPNDSERYSLLWIAQYAALHGREAA